MDAKKTGFGAQSVSCFPLLRQSAEDDPQPAGSLALPRPAQNTSAELKSCKRGAMAALGPLIGTAGEQSHGAESAFGWGGARRVSPRCAR